MLLEFKTRNYKSFKDELKFSMIPAPKQKGLDYSILKEKIEKTEHKGLSSAIVYGPNASGKTNIIGAMDTFKNIILRGHIKNVDNIPKNQNHASNSLELIPCCFQNVKMPVDFSIKFIENSLLIEYSICVDIGNFLEKNYKRNIISEILKINENIIYERNESLIKFENLDSILGYLNNGKNNEANSIANNSLNNEELFLTNGFKTIFSTKLVSIITGWFEEKFIVVYRADSIYLIKKLVDPQKDTIYIPEVTMEAAKIFGNGSNVIGYVAKDKESEPMLFSFFEGKETAIIAESFESYGTIRFINEFPLIFNAMKIGATLVVDEFDASIHPMAIMSIINIFHNDELNKKKAQLIFNTHNPIFLNNKLFRRDEIKFVERDDITHVSTHYSLSDFKTEGKKGVRKGEDYMKNYFVNQYGAIKNVDFSSIFTSNESNKE